MTRQRGPHGKSADIFSLVNMIAIRTECHVNLILACRSKFIKSLLESSNSFKASSLESPPLSTSDTAPSYRVRTRIKSSRLASIAVHFGHGLSHGKFIRWMSHQFTDVLRCTARFDTTLVVRIIPPAPKRPPNDSSLISFFVSLFMLRWFESFVRNNTGSAGLNFTCRPSRFLRFVKFLHLVIQIDSRDDYDYIVLAEPKYARRSGYVILLFPGARNTSLLRKYRTADLPDADDRRKMRLNYPSVIRGPFIDSENRNVSPAFSVNRYWQEHPQNQEHQDNHRNDHRCQEIFRVLLRDIWLKILHDASGNLNPSPTRFVCIFRASISLPTFV